MISLKTKPYPKIKVKINTGFIFIGESTGTKDEVRFFTIKPLKRKRGKKQQEVT